MAESVEAFEFSLQEMLKDLSENGKQIDLKPEQEAAIKSLVHGQDVLAILPTGFGKSAIYQILKGVKEKMSKDCACVLVICPLRSLIEDQIKEAKSMGLTANSLPEASLADVQVGKFQLLFSSAENTLDKEFLEILKKNSRFQSSLAAIVVDESHAVETWTGKRNKKLGKQSAYVFREAFGRLSILRSFFKQDALTVLVSPNRENLRFSVKKVKKGEMFQQLQWLVDLVLNKGTQCPKTIIFCNTLSQIASVVNYLMMKLGNAIYSGDKESKNCLIGIYHSNSWPASKERLVASFKENGVKRIVVATSALSMGINFPDICYVINWGPARTILDQLQQAARAGRDGFQSHIVVFYHGQQLGPCEKQVKEFVQAQGCYRVSAFQSLDNSIVPQQPLHGCCSYCSSNCQCGGTKCDDEILPFEIVSESCEVEKHPHKRSVTNDKHDVKVALMEVLSQSIELCSIDSTIYTWLFTSTC
ncbi:ATP-dependent DNA helicase RecQ-like [Montipora capricornis]|uniref:ATP-dependent DNA helicase RecQ-like n=1 Tax=Montipora capricornis TaxID=246305 RepID=UPI0035F21C9D